MFSLLITGSTEDERIKKAELILSKYGVSQFDTYSLKPELSIKIAEIRELTRWLSLSPYESKNKACLIFQAEKLTIEAQNALLNSLEEPPERTIIILLTNNDELLLPTIVSRCQVINLATKQGITLNQKEITQLLNCFIVLKNGNCGEKFKLAQEIGKGREETIEWLDKEIVVLESLLKEKLTSKEKKESPLFPCSIVELFNMIRRFQKTKKYLKANVNPRFTLENLFLELDFPIRDRNEATIR